MGDENHDSDETFRRFERMTESWSSDIISAGGRDDWQPIMAGLFEQIEIEAQLQEIVEKLSAGERLSKIDGLFLFDYDDLDALGQIADVIKISRYGERVFFNHNVHINQTNICVLSCSFCAFRRGRKATDAYAHDIGDYLEILRGYAPHVDEVHSVGGLHPDWDIEHYENLFTATKEEFPHLHIKALTAVEVKHISKISGLTVSETLGRLQQSGLGSLPGGGAEILNDSIRDIICKGKETSQEYLEIHRIAHTIGMPTNCTMLFGTIENAEHRVEHMLSLRRLQDETGGFQCFVPYPYLPDSSRLPEAQLATGSEILRVIAISRILLDNIPHIKAYRMNLGDGISELALRFGADDIDGTVQLESIMHLAGSTAPLDHDKEQLARLIRDAGCIPVQRNSTYTRFSEYQTPARKSWRLPMAK